MEKSPFSGVGGGSNQPSGMGGGIDHFKENTGGPKRSGSHSKSHPQRATSVPGCPGDPVPLGNWTPGKK